MATGGVPDVLSVEVTQMVAKLTAHHLYPYEAHRDLILQPYGEYMKMEEMRPIIALMWMQDVLVGTSAAPKFTVLKELEYILMSVLKEDPDAGLPFIVHQHLTPEVTVDLLRSVVLALRMIDHPKYGGLDLQEDVLEYAGTISNGMLSLLCSLKDHVHSDGLSAWVKNFAELMMSVKSSVYFSAVEFGVAVDEHQPEREDSSVEDMLRVTHSGCALCEEQSYSAEFAVLPGCSHTFCVSCAKDWWTNNTTCPTCSEDSFYWISSTKLQEFQQHLDSSSGF